MPIRIIFDRCAVDREAFQALVDSPLLELIKRKQLSVYHTPYLLEETLSLCQKHPVVLKEQLPFILNICNMRWFRPMYEVWRRSLVMGSGLSESLFISQKERQRLEENLKTFLLSDPLNFEGIDKAFYEKDRRWKEHEKLRKIHIGMRDEMSKKLTEAKMQLNQLNTFQEHRDALMDKFCLPLLTAMLEKIPEANGREDEIAARWGRNQERHPYVTLYMEGLLFIQYHAQRFQSDKVDRNGPEDIKILTYLHGTDVIVSNETHFLRAAFDVIYAPRGKKFMTTKQFLEFINSKSISLRNN